MIVTKVVEYKRYWCVSLSINNFIMRMSGIFIILFENILLFNVNINQKYLMKIYWKSPKIVLMMNKIKYFYSLLSFVWCKFCDLCKIKRKKIIWAAINAKNDEIQKREKKIIVFANIKKMIKRNFNRYNECF